MKASEKRSGIHLQKLRKEIKFTAAGSIIIWSHNEKAVAKIMVYTELFCANEWRQSNKEELLRPISVLIEN